MHDNTKCRKERNSRGLSNEILYKSFGSNLEDGLTNVE